MSYRHQHPNVIQGPAPKPSSREHSLVRFLEGGYFSSRLARSQLSLRLAPSALAAAVMTCSAVGLQYCGCVMAVDVPNIESKSWLSLHTQSQHTCLPRRWVRVLLPREKTGHWRIKLEAVRDWQGGGPRNLQALRPVHPSYHYDKKRVQCLSRSSLLVVGTTSVSTPTHLRCPDALVVTPRYSCTMRSILSDLVSSPPLVPSKPTRWLRALSAITSGKLRILDTSAED